MRNCTKPSWGHPTLGDCVCWTELLVMSGLREMLMVAEWLSTCLLLRPRLCAIERCALASAYARPAERRTTVAKSCWDRVSNAEATAPRSVQRSPSAVAKALLRWQSTQITTRGITVAPPAGCGLPAARRRDEHAHPDTRWRSGAGLRRVGSKWGAARTERACEIASRIGGRSYKPVANIPKHSRNDHEGVQSEATPIVHNQVRGPRYYQ
jgi:hypothetical protein